jgi:hypothetical protein
VGTAYALRRRADGTGDVVAHTIRGSGALFLFGGTPGEYFRQYVARGTGPTGGKEANVHWTDFQRGFGGPVSPLGTMVGIMAGMTLSFRIRRQDRVGMVFYGDGATSTDAWHEGLNFAGEIAMRVNEGAFEWLDGPILRVTAVDTPVPYAGTMEGFFLPEVTDIVTLIRYLAEY